MCGRAMLILVCVCLWRSENNIVELVFSFHIYVGSGNQTQAVGRVLGKHFTC